MGDAIRIIYSGNGRRERARTSPLKVGGVPTSFQGAGCKMRKGSTRQWTMPNPINPKKKALGPSVNHSMLGTQWRAANLPDSPPTDLRGQNLPTSLQ